MEKINITKLIELANYLYSYLITKNFNFTKEGYPIFRKEHFAVKKPTEMITYERRLKSKDVINTSICFFQTDNVLYRYCNIDKLKKCAEELLKFHSFVGFDLSIFRDFLYPFQKFFILLNLLIDAFFISFGNKMIPNLRCDQRDGTSYFHLFEEAPLVCAGTLGCSLKKSLRDSNTHLINQYLLKHPKQQLIIFGSNLTNFENIVCFKRRKEHL